MIVEFAQKVRNLNMSYNDVNKTYFHRVGKKVMKEIANLMGFNPSDYEIRSNKGGIAVSGEVILHHNKIYIQFSENGILFRKCNGMTDYCGERNNWLNWNNLIVVSDCIRKFKSILN
jgi:hypothetical protein